MNEELHILIVDDDQRMAKTLKDIFTVKGYEAEVAHSGAEAIEKVTESHFGLVISDIKMPEMNGVELYKAIKGVQPDTPVILMTAYATDDLVKEGLAEGAIATLNKPLDIEAILSFLSILRKERSILIVDDDPQFCRTLGDILRIRGFSVTQITDPHDVMDKIGEDRKVLLLDMRLNGFNGLDILKNIRKKHPNLPVIMVTGYREEMGSMIDEALNISAYTCLYKPLQIEKLIEVLREVHHKGLGTILGQPFRKKQR
jgi:two-component system, NtrC family, response regulator HydG